MKRKTGAILILIGSFVCLIGVLFFVTYVRNSNIQELDYEIITKSYSDYQSKIISTYDEYLSDYIGYMDEENNKYGDKYRFDKDRYNKEYFETKSLAIINVVTGSGMNKLKSIKIYRRDNILYCDADIKYATGNATDDINSIMILVEIDKDIKSIRINK